MTADFCTKGPTPDIGCQNNCDQPGSGASGGNVQSRVIGYYESWAHDRACTGMVRSHIPYGDEGRLKWLRTSMKFQSMG